MQEGQNRAVADTEVEGPRSGGKAPSSVRVAILWVPNASISGVYAAHEDFANFNHVREKLERSGPVPRFEARVVSVSGRPERSLSGARLHPDGRLPDDQVDAVVVPALIDDRTYSVPGEHPLGDPRLLAWLRAQYEGGAVVAGTCTGSFLMAEAGLLDGEPAATHWLYEEAFARRFPTVALAPRRWLVIAGPDGRLLTGGSSLYMADINLRLLSRFAGQEATHHFAKLFGKFWRDDPRDYHARDVDRPLAEDATVAAAQAWLRENLTRGATVRGAADHVYLAERTLTRRFQRALGVSPSEYLRALRIERARELLERNRLPIEEVAARLGYADPAAFRRTFKRRVGLTPAAYRRRFKLPPRWSPNP